MDLVRTEHPTFRDMAETLGLGMPFQMHASADGTFKRFTYIGSSCEALTGVAPAAALMNPDLLYNCILEEHRPCYLDAERAALAERRPFRMEVLIHGPEGQLRWARIVSAPRFLGDGSTLWDGLVTDITESRRLEQALERQRRRMELAVEATGLGLWEWDLRTGDVVWSEHNREIFGVAPGASVTLDTYLRHIHPDDLELTRRTFLHARDKAVGPNFSLEHRIVTDAGEVKWLMMSGRMIRDARGPALVVGTTLDVTERRTAEERSLLMMGELAHRSKNGMQIMAAMVRQAAQGADTVQAMEAVLSARIRAMAASQDLLTASGGQAVGLGDLFDQVLTMFDLGRFQIDLALRQVTMSGETAIGVALLLHELGTNAVKHGALSRAGGMVLISVQPAPDGCAAFRWREQGGPEVAPSGRRGFGSRLLEAALRDRGGRVESSFEPTGFSAVIEIKIPDLR
ncbi:hypothetical protein DJ018_02870 [Phenylobacterium deserti]|uniref:histidine kinase n=2 Tax=Phenylobacterium deserti TaxID=1914756 RepID=A0A328AVH7_9CAUL|nr:hypothetical protein DJ018_02870 [Phenylobacterium deserti]